MTTSFVLDAVEQTIWTRAGHTDLTALVHHNDRGSQHTSIRFRERLAAAGIAASVGSVGDRYDTPSRRRSTASTRLS